MHIKFISIILTICFVLYLGIGDLAISKNKARAQMEQHACLIVKTDYTGLVVRIDGEVVGYTPTGVVCVEEGMHRVTVSHPDRRNWMDSVWTMEVTITSGDTLALTPEFQRSYSIQSEPYGAEVYKDSEKLGTTPALFSIGEDEEVEMRLSKEGYRDTTFTINVNSPRFYRIQLNPERRVHFDVTGGADEFRKKSNDKLYLYSAIGFSVLSGALALYFHDKGNDRYDQYLVTGDPQRSEKLFDDARRFDKYAIVSLGAFQLGFVFSFYFFLKQTNR